MSKTHIVSKKFVSIAMTAILSFGFLPAFGLPTASAATVETVYAAAYMGATTAAETTLPAEVEVDGLSTPVTWNIGDDTFAVPYDTATVTGMAGGTSVSANVEIVPPSANPLVYFVDSGRGGDSLGMPATSSPVFEAVKELSDSTLLNEAPDQRYVSGSTDWGF
ncbi:hypothetical protein [Paenibacillus hexagrammi]|uniref:Uncharacterized protein n=1 Tax=Paenibacillus hexagrammi TaxID=2908839 RepID=A0ABY3SC98_9BACL|nr:hypothetical protein [Paenibacillus sp. YPD9-1]UJF31412.1 hypothetical protein L0M14_16405 [Paenibacillus sp. YPD9-1]